MKKVNALAVISVWMCCFMLGNFGTTDPAAAWTKARYCYKPEWNPHNPDCGYVSGNKNYNSQQAGVGYIEGMGITCDKFNARDLSDAYNANRTVWGTQDMYKSATLNLNKTDSNQSCKAQ